MKHQSTTIIIKKKHLYFAAAFILVIAGLLIYFASAPKSSEGASSRSTVDGKISFKDAIGKPAPIFSLESSSGTAVNLADLKGKTVILFFNEGSMCYPACWNQIRDLANDVRFNTDTVKSFSVVVDPKKVWDKIMQEQSEYKSDTILFDVKRDVSEAYDVMYLKSSMHKGSQPGHTFVIIDKEGIVRYTYDDPTMGIRNDEIATQVEKLST